MNMSLADLDLRPAAAARMRSKVRTKTFNISVSFW
jgi:hypothetical protein